MDGEKKRDTKELAEYGTRTNSSLHGQHTCEGRILEIELGMGE